MKKYPSYLEAYDNGTLKKAIEATWSSLSSCVLCPRSCKVNRLKDELGICRTGLKARVCNFMPHHGEEPPISGRRGSGAIFFSGCNMNCAYCQNYEFSQKDEGREVTPEELAGFMLQLQKKYCHNINLVTPTHVIPQILAALSLAIPQGLNIPLVYNTGGYELPGVIQLLEGIVDIYLPDMRYADSAMAIKYSNAPDYPNYNMQSLLAMHQQVGISRVDDQGIITRGVIIRHLVLPENISGTEVIMEFISKRLSMETYISLMSQYLPCYNAHRFKELSRRITKKEYAAAQKIMQKYNLHNGWIQDAHGLESLAGIHIKPM